jgi:hypothetical protein
MRGLPSPPPSPADCMAYVPLRCDWSAWRGVVHRGHSCGVQGECGHAPGGSFALQFGVGGGQIVLGCIVVAPVQGCAAVVSWVCG